MLCILFFPLLFFNQNLINNALKHRHNCQVLCINNYVIILFSVINYVSSLLFIPTVVVILEHLKVQMVKNISEHIFLLRSEFSLNSRLFGELYNISIDLLIHGRIKTQFSHIHFFSLHLESEFDLTHCYNLLNTITKKTVYNKNSKCLTQECYKLPV